MIGLPADCIITQRMNRHGPLGYQRLSAAQFVLLGIVMLLILALGSYHITHGGWNSGRLELASFFLLALALFPPHRSKRSFRNYSPLQLGLIGMVDFWAIYFGIYHLSTPDGLRSGIMELTAFTLLTTAVFLPGKKRPPRP